MAQAKRDSTIRTNEKKNIKGLMAKIQSERKLEGKLVEQYGTKTKTKGFKSDMNLDIKENNEYTTDF